MKSKKSMRKFYLVFLLAVVANNLPAQFTWLNKRNLDTALFEPNTFVLNGKGYMVGGRISSAPLIYIDDVKEYDPVNDAWATKNNFPYALVASAGFAINGKGYIVGGQTLINKTTGKRYMLEGFDNAPEVPLVSPDGNSVLVCGTDVYENSGSFIELYDVNRGKDGIVLLERWRTDSKQEEYPDMTPEQMYQYAVDQDLWSFVEVADTMPENEGLDNPYQDYSPYMISNLVWVNNTCFAFECYRIKYTEEGRLRSMPLFVKATISRH